MFLESGIFRCAVYQTIVVLQPMRMLQTYGFVYSCGTDSKLVYEKTLLLQSLIGIAQQQVRLFNQYDLGGAEELKFTSLCIT